MFLVNGETDWLSSLDNSSLLILLLVSICWEPAIVDKYESGLVGDGVDE